MRAEAPHQLTFDVAFEARVRGENRIRSGAAVLCGEPDGRKISGGF